VYLCGHLPYLRETFAPYLTEDGSIKEISGIKFLLETFSKHNVFSNFLLLQCVLNTFRGVCTKSTIRLTIFHWFIY
jgi:hypothetical protein